VLCGLDEQGLAALAAAVLRADVDEEFARWLHSFTGGNALFAISTLTELLDRGEFTVGSAPPGPPSSAPVAVHLRDSLQRRIAGLGTRSRRAVDVLAVHGQPASPAFYGDLLDSADLAPAIDAGIVL